MEFSMETLKQISQILVAVLQKQLAQGEQISFTEMEQEIRKALQVVGQTSLGQMLSLQDVQDHAIKQRCPCQGLAGRI